MTTLMIGGERIGKIRRELTVHALDKTEHRVGHQISPRDFPAISY